PGVAGRKTYPIHEIDRRKRALARTESRPDRTIIAEDRTVVARHDHRRIGGGNIGERRVRVLDTDLLVALAAVRDFVDRLVGIHEVAAVVVGELNCRDARPTTRFFDFVPLDAPAVVLAPEEFTRAVDEVDSLIPCLLCDSDIR